VANDEMPAAASPFDVKAIRRLAEVMSQHDLSEIMLETEAGQLRLRRGPRGVISALPTAMPVPVAAAPASPTAPPPAPTAAKPVRNLTEIKSEAIGTFYSKANPDAEPYVKVGSKVTPTTVVGLIEAMKMFNEITAGCSGTIAEILIQNQDPVEYGSVLFRVEPG
jgi:acetyl-CoA carboxylase biotin carboxyl carrier protein